MPGPNTPYTQLSADQVIQQSFDESNDRIRVDAVVSATIADVVINADESNIAVKDPNTGNTLKVNGDGSIDANIVADASSDSIQAWTHDGSGNAITSTSGKLDVNVASIGLPAGASTEAKQDTGNTSLASIDTKLTTINTTLGSPFQAGGSIGNTAFGVNNGSGASAVNIQDGGNSITVDGTVAISGIVPISNIGTVSTVNSTTTPLGSNGNFTGTYENILAYSGICVQIVSDKNSSSGGVVLTFSTDGTNTDDTITYTYVAANGGLLIQVPPASKFFKIDYTNTSSAQSYFRLQTIYTSVSTSLPVTHINSTIVNDSYAAMTRSVIVGASTAGGGSFVNVKVTPSGAVNTALGDISGIVGQTTMANSLPVTMASNQGNINVNLAASGVIGQTTKSASIPVTIASDQENIRQLLLEDTNTVATYTWSDFNTNNERISTIVYTSSNYPGRSATQTFAYTLTSGAYRLDTDTWSYI